MWPFKKKTGTQTPVARRTASADVELQKLSSGLKLIRIGSLDFRGTYTESPNGNYLIAWADNHGRHGGFRHEGHGKYALIRGDQVLVAGDSLERPQNGKVASDGTFILSDAFFGVSSASRLHAFSPEGVEILRLDFQAKVYDVALSPDGSHAVVQLCGSPMEDANHLVLVNVADRRLAWKTPNTAWAESYEFDDKRQLLRLHYAERASVEFPYVSLR